MIEGYINVGDAHSDAGELESAAVAGAAAVQTLIADRNNLRNQLAAAKTGQKELRQKVATLHRSYINRRVTISLPPARCTLPSRS